MLNKDVTKKIMLRKSVGRGSPRSPLIFNLSVDYMLIELVIRVEFL